MKRLTLEQKKNELNELLNSVTKNNPELTIYSMNKGVDAIFCVAERIHGAMNPKSDFMDYKNMRSFLYGAMAVIDNRIKFRNDNYYLTFHTY